MYSNFSGKAPYAKVPTSSIAHHDFQDADVLFVPGLRGEFPLPRILHLVELYLSFLNDKLIT